ncbi:MAG: MBL fold metallo-hydrolase [Hyphomicrobiaceae bacterium]|nr:MBL fold metallo-hydrolase [Hyphomicrobiaceae bacterium]
MYEVHVLVQGYPGRAICHGGLGWSTVTLLRGHGRIVLIDVGGYATRKEIAKQLDALSIAPDAVTDVILTHTHHDHAVNFVLFPKATVWIGDEELTWATKQIPGFNPLAELHARELSISPRVKRLRNDEHFLEGFQAIHSPGHTPGHLAYYFEYEDQRILFTGDAAKNRAELLAMDVDMTQDREASKATLARFWELWKAHPQTVLIPGHDLSMTLDHTGRPQYIGERRAGIEAWFSETMETTAFDLCAHQKPAFVNYR